MLHLPLEPEKYYLTSNNKIVQMEYYCQVTKKFIYTTYPNEMFEVETGKGATNQIVAEIPMDMLLDFFNKVKGI